MPLNIVFLEDPPTSGPKWFFLRFRPPTWVCTERPTCPGYRHQSFTCRWGSRPGNRKTVAVLKSAPSMVTRVPPPVERYVVPKRPTVVPTFSMADFPMTLPGLPSSIASSPATTLAPETPTSRAPSGQLPSAATSPKPMGPPPVQSPAPKPKAPSKEQVQIEVDTIMKEVEEKRAKRTSDEQQLHDAILAAIFKSVFEDTVPENFVGIYSSGKKDRVGCEIPKVIDFRTLPINVQDDLTRAEILPTMWPRYRISGYERMFHYRLMTVMRRAMIYKATCHTLSPGAADNMYPRSVDKEHRDWINELMHTSGGPSESVDQLILAAFECAIDILHEAGSFVTGVDRLNAYQLDLFVFKDMGIGGIIAKLIGRMNDPDIGGYEGYSLTEPAATWYRSLYTDYMTYLDIAGRDAVLAAQVASP